MTENRSSFHPNEQAGDRCGSFEGTMVGNMQPATAGRVLRFGVFELDLKQGTTQKGRCPSEAAPASFPAFDVARQPFRRSGNPRGDPGKHLVRRRGCGCRSGFEFLYSSDPQRTRRQRGCTAIHRNSPPPRLSLPGPGRDAGPCSRGPSFTSDRSRASRGRSTGVRRRAGASGARSPVHPGEAAAFSWRRS